MSLGIVLVEGKPSFTKNSIREGRVVAEARQEMPHATDTIPMCPRGSPSGCQHPGVSEKLREEHNGIGFWDDFRA